MSIHDAEPGDIYVDGIGKLWRVVWTLQQPSVGVEAVEAAHHIGGSPHFPKQSGGVGGLMWQGFKRIYRPDQNSNASATADSPSAVSEGE